MSTASVTDLADFLSARFGTEAPQRISRFRGNLLTAGDYVGAARLTCVQALWSHEEAIVAETVDQVEPIETGWPRVYFGGA